MSNAGQNNSRVASRGVPSRQVAWVVRLRWIAGGVIVVGGLIDQFWLHVYGRGWAMAAVGAAVLLYNVFFRAALRSARKNRVGYALVWGQMVADMLCLAFLVSWSGGYTSPLRGFFVFHMVFASLLLPRAMAFGIAAVAIVLVEGMLLLSNRDGGGIAGLGAGTALGVAIGWAVTLLATVYLASRIARDLRRKRRRLARQNRRIERMSQRLQAQQQAMAQQEKMVALGQMAAGVAHEVANPLASMDGLLQLLERRPQKISADNLARLREQVARINQIVRQLTSFARPTEGEAEWVQANLNDVVIRALEVLRFDTRLKRVTVAKTLDEKLPALRMHPPALEQVVVNLVINACDAMEQVAAPKLELKTEARDGCVELSITDNGAGIDSAVIARIFEPFFTTKPVGKGTGLGLSISYSLVRKHGGDIEVSSTPGKGTRMQVRLPIPGDSRFPSPVSPSGLSS